MSLSNKPTQRQPALVSSLDRRSFLGLVGLSAGMLALSSCKKDETAEDNRPSIDMGSGDQGLIRLGYAMEVFLVSFLEDAAAVRQAAEGPLRASLLRMRNLHQVYLDLFTHWANGDLPGPLLFDTTKANLRITSQMAANTFYLMDVASSAYGGMAERFTDPAKSLTMAKMAASCARQSSVLRPVHSSSNWNIRTSSDLANNSSGLFPSRSPGQVASALDPFLANRWNTSQLP